MRRFMAVVPGAAAMVALAPAGTAMATGQNGMAEWGEFVFAYNDNASFRWLPYVGEPV